MADLSKSTLGISERCAGTKFFVEESGEWGEYKSHSPYYIITFVFHNQEIDILDDLLKLDAELKILGTPVTACILAQLFEERKIIRGRY